MGCSHNRTIILYINKKRSCTEGLHQTVFFPHIFGKYHRTFPIVPANYASAAAFLHADTSSLAMALRFVQIYAPIAD